ncbi:hypothetical protein D3C80_2038080 [compost metagenome]
MLIISLEKIPDFEDTDTIDQVIDLSIADCKFCKLLSNFRTCQVSGHPGTTRTQFLASLPDHILGQATDHNSRAFSQKTLGNGLAYA